MSSTITTLAATEYLRMAEELEAMAAAIAQSPGSNHHFAERLQLLARQMREDGAHLEPSAFAAAVTGD